MAREKVQLVFIKVIFNNLTLCHSYLKPYCKDRKTTVFSAAI